MPLSEFCGDTVQVVFVVYGQYAIIRILWLYSAGVICLWGISVIAQVIIEKCAH